MIWFICYVIVGVTTFALFRDYIMNSFIESATKDSSLFLIYDERTKLTVLYYVYPCIYILFWPFLVLRMFLT